MTFATYAVALDGRPVLPHARAMVVGGRVLLPVRALGTALGAQVDYDAATRTIVVRRGAVRARLSSRDGVTIAGATAYAPLRAAARAFSLSVRYDGATRTVALDDGAPIAATAVPPVPLPTASPAAPTAALVPADGAKLHDPYPALSARFPGVDTIDAGSLRVTLDGVDVTARANVVGDTVLYTPQTALAAGAHRVIVTGRSASGAPLNAQWGFSDDFAFAPGAARTSAPAVRYVYVDDIVGPGTSAFDVIVVGEAGITGAAAVDGVNQRFPLLVRGADSYVAHIVIPPGVVQPFAHVAVRLNFPDGSVRSYVVPRTFTIVTATPAPAPTAPPTPVTHKRYPLAVPASPSPKLKAATPPPRAL